MSKMCDCDLLSRTTEVTFVIAPYVTVYQYGSDEVGTDFDLFKNTFSETQFLAMFVLFNTHRNFPYTNHMHAYSSY